MTREQQIQHWADIARAVFRAEDKISKEWRPKLLRATEGDVSQEERTKVADEYLAAIATEIIDHSGWTFEEEECPDGQKSNKS